MYTIGCKDVPVRYAAAFAIIVLSLAGAYYLIQAAENLDQQGQPEANTTNITADTNTTTQPTANTTRDTGVASPEPCISSVYGTASAGERTVTLRIWAERPCNATITVDHFGGEWSGQLGEGENNIRITVEGEPDPGSTASVRIRTENNTITYIITFGP